MSLRSNVFRLVVPALLAVASPSAADDPGPDALAGELRAIYHNQTPDGAFRWTAESRFFEQFPVMASICHDVHLARPNAALLSQSASAIGRYYGYLFSTADRDHDLLVETVADGALIEDVGFNALLALDLAGLARLQLEIRRPYQALYWYDASRALQDAVVRSGFDVDASYFFPNTAADDRSTGRYHALSALPLLFPGRVGNNHATAVVREYLTNPVARAPESPYLFLAGPTTSQSDGVTAAGRALKSLVLLRVLEARGFREDAATFRAQSKERADAELASFVAAGGSPAAYNYHLIRLMDAGDAIDDPYLCLDVFAALLVAMRALEDNELVKIQSGVEAVKRFLTADARTKATPSDANLAAIAARSLYVGVSETREKLEANALIPSSAYRSIGAVDPPRAVANLLDDVVGALHTVESRFFPVSGLRANATVMRERALSGDPVEVKWTLETVGDPVTIRGATASAGADRTELVVEGNPITLVPGAAQTFTSTFRIDGYYVDALQPVTLTLDLVLDDNDHLRTHALRSVFIEQPVDVTASFPNGRLLTAGNMPVDVRVTKRTQEPAIIRFEWYSPAGLVLSEGRSGEYAMESAENDVALPLNVVVPSPCHPGRFPFKLKFFANGTELGMIASSMFKPFQWVFAGTFPASADPTAAVYPPEQGVNVLDVYQTGGGAVRWRLLSQNSYNQGGEVTLRNAMSGRGVGYLYTVVESHYAATLPAFLAATAPAELFVNGESVVRVDASAMAAPSYARVPFVKGPNHVLIKVAGDPNARVFFNLGDENDESSFSIANNLAESLDDYETLARRMSGEEEYVGDAQKLVTLRYHAPDAHAVSVVGTFNGWSPDQARMRRLGDGGWEIVLSLPPGRYAYRFLVDDRQQVLDPNSPLHEPDGYGGENSVMVIE